MEGRVAELLAMRPRLVVTRLSADHIAECHREEDEEGNDSKHKTQNVHALFDRFPFTRFIISNPKCHAGNRRAKNRTPCWLSLHGTSDVHWWCAV
jgi:hypothetical protein